MRYPLTWFVIGWIGFASLAPWAEAASSSRTVQVLIIIPERPARSHQDAPALPEIPAEPALSRAVPPTNTLHRLPDGSAIRTYTQFQL